MSQTNAWDAHKVRAKSNLVLIIQSVFESSHRISVHITLSAPVSYVFSSALTNTMSDATSPTRSWKLPAWVEQLISNQTDGLKDISEFDALDFEIAKETSNVVYLVRLRRAAEIQSHWLDSEVDRLRKEKDMLSAGEDPYIDEETSRLQDVQEVRFLERFLNRIDFAPDEDVEQRDDRQDVLHEITEFERLIQEGKEEILKVEQEIMEIKA